jgi:hypothetical protein
LFEQFTIWKNGLEKETNCKYIQHEAPRDRALGQCTYLYCHRSGQVYKSERNVGEKRLHAGKSQGKSQAKKSEFFTMTTCGLFVVRLLYGLTV